ncbi:unnamed protein product [Orchesella dallaii]|uniref:Transcriptional coactivator p15 (PC4) C-terminal domain-containing protein n=1 Tax=Orchesella dallaii TaxID=48710 RepID=A0ABP1Q662_9HEXA
MPKTKKLEESSDSDSDSSGPRDRNPPPKKQLKTEPSSAKSSSSKSKSGGEGEESSWTLDKKRVVKINEFRGTVYVDIREYYEKDGEMRPGKKGISLSASQWQKLKDVMPEIDSALKTH